MRQMCVNMTVYTNTHIAHHRIFKKILKILFKCQKTIRGKQSHPFMHISGGAYSLTARSTRHLHSAEQGLLHVPFARTSTMQSRAFSVVGPLVWNGLPLALRSLPRVFSLKFLQQLKTTLFGRAGVVSASE